MSVKKTVIGIGMAMAMFTSAGRAGTPQVYLTVSDTAIYPGDPGGRYLTILMSNPTVKIGGFSVGLSSGDPSIIQFTYFKIDTTLPHWRYFIRCTPPPCRPDSIYDCPDTCFKYKSKVDTVNTRCSNAKFIDATRESEIVLQVTGKFIQGAGPALQPGSGVLFRVPLNIFPISDSVPLADRQVPITIDPIYTNFSDSTGNTTYRVQDTTLQITNGTVTVPYSMKGDVNFDGLFTGADVVRLLNYTFLGAPEPVPAPEVGDVDCDGIVTGADVVRELNKVFLGTPFPCQ